MATKTSLPSYFSQLFLILLVLSITESSSQPDHFYASFAFDASTFPREAEYDYIVVGGGTTGCPLAATLSEDHRVLLLERGGDPREFPDVMTQDGFLRTLLETNPRDSPAQAFISEEGVANARGRVLGGSSAINAGFYSRGDPDFFGNGGCGPVKWDMALVNESYEWVERAATFQPLLGSWQAAVRDGLLEANVTPFNGFTVHHVVGTKIGASTFDPTGRRHSAADLLNHAKAANIRVALRATVERVLFNTTISGGGSGEEDRVAAIGVVYRDRYGRLHQARIQRDGEVIISAGALGSPQLLLLSGIGPRHHLTSMGIPVLYHSPYVGELMRDNPRNGISIASPVPMEHSLIQVVGITPGGAYIEAASNILPFFSPSHPLFLRGPSPATYFTVATLMEKVAGPSSAGTLRLATLDARDNPAVRFNYFSDPADMARCVAGGRKVGEAMRGTAMAGFRFPAKWIGSGRRRREFRYVARGLPANQSNDEEMEEWCRRTVATIWHSHGGCVAGKVVDGEFRVMGVMALRVVDGSTLLASPGTNPQATLLMLGRYIGQKMKAERRMHSRDSTPKIGA